MHSTHRVILQEPQQMIQVRRQLQGAGDAQAQIREGGVCGQQHREGPLRAGVRELLRQAAELQAGAEVREVRGGLGELQDVLQGRREAEGRGPRHPRQHVYHAVGARHVRLRHRRYPVEADAGGHVRDLQRLRAPSHQREARRHVTATDVGVHHMVLQQLQEVLGVLAVAQRLQDAGAQEVDGRVAGREDCEGPRTFQGLKELCLPQGVPEGGQHRQRVQHIHHGGQALSGNMRS
mmetsp:Transcript_98580/g.234814  ORF Transcript_98580/g.234814 Transcript_98580/m.234814 type:complete len:235 (-) Transcript_98580:58-762(-)